MSAHAATLDHAWIQSHIPHQGAMCLLDRVERWDEQQIVCVARSHTRADNPLRCGDSLGIAAAIEYAAQAIAVHSVLLIGNGERLSAGFLTSARNVQWQRARLDDVDGELCVQANRLSGNDLTVLYGFAVSAGGQTLIDGRIGIFLNSAAAHSLSSAHSS